MTTFDERERSYEKKFAMDEELRFKAEARRNKLVGQWAATLLGLSGDAVDDYVKAVRRADLVEKGDEDVFRKIRKDFDDKGVLKSDAVALDEAHAAPTAAGRGLHHHRQADLACFLLEIGVALVGALIARHARHGGIDHAPLGGSLVNHGGDRGRAG